MNVILNFLFLPAIFLIGIFSTLSDIKTGKVRNSLIKNGFLYGLWIYSCLFLWTLVRKYSGLLAIFAGKTYYLNFNYFFDLIVNVIIALIVAVILWKLNFWAAADAKLFILFSFLIPLTVYSHNRIIYFPSFILLLNIYIICFFYLIFSGIFNIRFKKTDFTGFYGKIKQKIIKFLEETLKNIQTNNILEFINLTSIYLIIFFIIFSFKLRINIFSFSLPSQILLYLCLFLIYRPLTKFLKKYKKLNIFVFSLLIIAIFIISYLGFDFREKFNLFSKFFSGFFIFVITIIIIANFLSKQEKTRKIKLENLRTNMILKETTINILKQDKIFFQKEINKIYFDGLSSAQVEKIKIFLKNKNLKEVEIYKTFPFAPFIFTGAIITLIFHGSFLSWITWFLIK